MATRLAPKFPIDVYVPSVVGLPAIYGYRRDAEYGSVDYGTLVDDTLVDDIIAQAAADGVTVIVVAEPDGTPAIPDGSVLVWDTATERYIPGEVASGGGATALDGLTDVDTAGVVDGNTLVYSAGAWSPVQLDAADVGALPGDTVVPDTPDDIGAAAVVHTHAESEVTGLATVATSGAYADLSGQPVIPDTADDIGASPVGHTHGYDGLPAGTTVCAYWDDTAAVWPARPTARTDITVQWVGGFESTPPPGVAGVDVWLRDAAA